MPPASQRRGRRIEQQRGKRLGEVMMERIFTPLGMTDIAFNLTGSMRSRLALLHVGWTTSIASLSNPGEFDPGINKTWAYTVQRNEEDTVTGKPAGSLSWAGLGNLFYWIDRKNGIGGFWRSKILPFMDAVSYPGFVDFEAAVYRHRSRA